MEYALTDIIHRDDEDFYLIVYRLKSFCIITVSRKHIKLQFRSREMHSYNIAISEQVSQLPSQS